MSETIFTHIERFESMMQFELFLNVLNKMLTEKCCAEIEVQSHYGNNSTFQEKWFQRIGNNEIWRLVWPDPPFAGTFQLVDKKELTLKKWTIPHPLGISGNHPA